MTRMLGLVLSDDVPHAGGGVRAREQHPLRLERGGVDGQGQQDFKMVNPAWRDALASSGQTPTTRSIQNVGSTITD